MFRRYEDGKLGAHHFAVSRYIICTSSGYTCGSTRRMCLKAKQCGSRFKLSVRAFRGPRFQIAGIRDTESHIRSSLARPAFLESSQVTEASSLGPDFSSRSLAGVTSSYANTSSLYASDVFSPKPTSLTEHHHKTNHFGRPFRRDAGKNLQHYRK